jgi:hypothetical protein
MASSSRPQHPRDAPQHLEGRTDLAAETRVQRRLATHGCDWTSRGGVLFFSHLIQSRNVGTAVHTGLPLNARAMLRMGRARRPRGGRRAHQALRTSVFLLALAVAGCVALFNNMGAHTSWGKGEEVPVRQGDGAFGDGGGSETAAMSGRRRLLGGDCGMYPCEAFTDSQLTSGALLLHIVAGARKTCAHFVPILCPFCAHFVPILCPFCAHFVPMLPVPATERVHQTVYHHTVWCSPRHAPAQRSIPVRITASNTSHSH